MTRLKARGLVLGRDRGPDTVVGEASNRAPSQAPAQVLAVSLPIDAVVTGDEGNREARFLELESVDICYKLQNQSVHAIADAGFQKVRHVLPMFIGPSGCGMSTFFRLIAGFLYPSVGTLRFEHQTNLTPWPNRSVILQEFDQFFTKLTRRPRRHRPVGPRVHLGRGGGSLDGGYRSDHQRHAHDSRSHRLSGVYRYEALPQLTARCCRQTRITKKREGNWIQRTTAPVNTYCVVTNLGSAQ